MTKRTQWRAWVGLNTGQRSTNLLRGSISAVNYPCDQNESPTVPAKLCTWCCHLCPLPSAFLSADTNNSLSPLSVQSPITYLNQFVLLIQHFSRSSNMVVSLLPWKPRNHDLWRLQLLPCRLSSVSSHSHVGFRPPRKKRLVAKTENLPLLTAPHPKHRKKTKWSHLLIHPENPMWYAQSTSADSVIV